MKTYKELSTELNEILGFAARKAVGRRMAMMSKKASTKFKKAKNKLKAMSQDVAKKKAQKAVRNLIKQKTVGKSKDLATMSMGQKVALDKKVDKKDDKKLIPYLVIVQSSLKFSTNILYE